MSETKAHRFLRVVWNGKGVNFEIAKTEARTGLENLPRGPMLEAGLNCPRGRAVCEELDLRKFREPVDSGRVIAVFVGEKNRVDLGERFADAGEKLSQLADRKTGVDENAGLLRLQKGAIARTATAENAKPNRHGRNERLKG